MNVVKSARLAVAGALVLTMPFQGLSAAVRPSAAIPVAAASTVSAQDEREVARAGLAWPAIGVIIATIITAILIESHDGRGRGTGFSR